MIGDKLIGRYLRLVSRKHLAFQPFSSDTGLPAADPQRQYLLYVHIPFCVVLCPFCSFHRVRFKRDRAEQYFAALEQEIRIAAAAGYHFSEVYFGGGTPTVLPAQLAHLTQLLRSEFGVGRISAETNPDDLSAATLQILADAGIDRLSVGVQSFDNGLLREMERYDKYGSGEIIRERLLDARGSFETLNVDMMFNFPHQSEASLRRDLEVLTGEVAADQVSYYPLMATESTVKAMDKAIGRVDYGRERSFYRIIAEHMRAAGYQRSSSWCFSQAPTMIDEYITENEEYLGLGSGAFSYLDGSLYASTFSINAYLKRLADGRPAITRRSALNRKEQMRYYLLMRLFGGQLDLADANRHFGSSLSRQLWLELAGLRMLGAVQQRGNSLVLTESGQYLWVMMMREFFSNVNDFRERMRLEIRDEDCGKPQ
ncbi:MAG: coproporphyrinogen III oxidase family protein [Woeseiaceae bacterium]